MKANTQRTKSMLVALAGVSLIAGCLPGPTKKAESKYAETTTNDASASDPQERSLEECLKILDLSLDRPYVFSLDSGEDVSIQLYDDPLRVEDRVGVKMGEIFMQSAATNIQTGRASLEQVFLVDEQGNRIKYDTKKNIPDYDKWQDVYGRILRQGAIRKETEQRRTIEEALEYALDRTSQLPEKIERP